MPTLDRDAEVFVLDLGETENRFHPDWLAVVQEHLTTVDTTEGPRALVTTATGKYFSNGLDLEWLAANVPGCLVEIETSAGHLGDDPEAEIASDARWLREGIAPENARTPAQIG